MVEYYTILKISSGTMPNLLKGCEYQKKLIWLKRALSYFKSFFSYTDIAFYLYTIDFNSIEKDIAKNYPS